MSNGNLRGRGFRGMVAWNRAPVAQTTLHRELRGMGDDTSVRPIPDTFEKAAAHPSILAALMWHPQLAPDLGILSEASLVGMRREVAELARLDLKSGEPTESRMMAEE